MLVFGNFSADISRCHLQKQDRPGVHFSELQDQYPVLHDTLFSMQAHRAFAQISDLCQYLITIKTHLLLVLSVASFFRQAISLNEERHFRKARHGAPHTTAGKFRDCQEYTLKPSRPARVQPAEESSTKERDPWIASTYTCTKRQQRSTRNSVSAAIF